MAKPRDAYSVSYILSGCTIVFVAVVLREYGKLGAYVLAGFASILWIAFALVAVGINLARRRWRKSASILVPPLLIFTIGLFAHLSGLSTDKARLMFWKGSYLADVAALPESPSGMRIKIWPWRDYAGGFFAGADEQSEVLVYDSSDQMGLLRQFRSAEWYSTADRDGYSKSIFVHPELGEGGPHVIESNLNVRRIGLHFYILWMQF